MPPSTQRGDASLKRLQALDTDHENLDQKLHTLEATLNLPATPREARSAESGHSRAQWGATWLLKKLQSEEADGIEVRSSAFAWSLLKRILQNVPASVAARLIADHGFMRSFERSLATLVSSQESTNAGSQTGDAAHNPASQSKRKADGSPCSRPSKKRKTSDDSSLPSPSLDASLLRSLHDCVSNVRVHLQSRSDASGATAPDGWSWALQVNTESAANILAYSLQGLAVICREKISHHRDQTDIWVYLQTALLVWDNRKGASNDDAVTAFSQKALVPALDLLSITRSKVYFAWFSREDLRQSTSALELLIAKLVIVPSKAAFRQLNQAPDTSAQHTLQSLLKPLEDAMSTRTAPTRLLAAGAPIILDVGIRCSPLDSPKKKVTELPWLDNLFAHLCGLCGFDVAQEDSELAFFPEPLYSPMKTMLEKCATCRLRIDSKNLFQIIRLSSGSDPKWHRPVEWVVIAAAMAVNPEAVLLEREEEKPLILSHLLRKASSTAWMLTDDLVGLEMMGRSPKPFDYDFIKNGFVLPLIDAHQQSRTLSMFLNQWQSQLEAILLDHQREDKASVWLDDDLFSKISLTLEAALSLEQLGELVVEYATKASSKAEEGSTEVYAHFAILCGILASVRNTDAVKSIDAQLVVIIRTCGGILSRPLDQTFQWTAWRLLRTAFGLWMNTTPSLLAASQEQGQPTVFLSHFGLGEISAKAVDLLSKKSLKAPAPRLRESVECLACVGSMATALRRRSDNSTSEALISPVISELHRNLHTSTEDVLLLFGQCISHYPLLLEHGDGLDKASSLLELLLSHATKAIDSPESLHTMQPFTSDYPTTDEQGRLRATLFTNFLRNVKTQAPKASKALLNNLLTPKETGPSWLLTIWAVLQLNPVKLPDGAAANSMSLIMNASQFKVDHELVWHELVLRLSFMTRLSVSKGVIESVAHSPGGIWDFAFHFDINMAKKIVPDWDEAEKLFTEFMRNLFSDDKVLKAQISHWPAINGRLSEKGADKKLELVQRQAMLATVRQLLRRLAESPKQPSYLLISRDVARLICPRLAKQSAKKGDKDTNASKLKIETALKYCIQTLCLCEPSSLSEHNGTIHEFLTEYDRSSPRGASAALAAMALRSRLDPAKGPSIDIEGLLSLLRGPDMKQMDRAEILLFLDETLNSVAVNDRAIMLQRGVVSLLDRCESTECLQLLNIIITSPKNWARDLDVSFALVRLSPQMTKTDSIHRFKMVVTSVISLLKSKHAHPSQHAVESVVLGLTTLASRNSPSLPQSHARQIYTLICIATQTLLSVPLTRKHLRGRMHLLMPLLQALLRCLFTSTSHQAIAHPSWLKASHPLTAKTAHHLARIFSAVADPTSGSVAMHGRGQGKELNDATAAAREYAGRYAPLLLGELANCTMKGRWCADGAREALLPGVWTLVAGVARMENGLDTLSAGLGSGAREVVRGLISEWRRVRGG